MKDKLTGELKLATRKGPAYSDVIFRRLEKSVPKDELVGALLTQPDQRYDTLMRMLCDPAFKGRTLPTLAKECGLSYAQVLRCITTHHIDQGMLTMSRHVPAIMEDTAVDAKSKTIRCPVCEGAGTIDKLNRKGEVVGDKPCLTCEGLGKLRKVGDIESRKLVYETMGLTNKGKGPSVAIQVNSGAQVEDSVDIVHDALNVEVTPVEPNRT